MVRLVLRAYCLALVKACDFVHARIATEYYYEVSDWYNFKSYTDLLMGIRRRTLLLSSTTAAYYRNSILSSF